MCIRDRSNTVTNSGTFTLDNSSLGELIVNGQLTITGLDADSAATIDANGLDDRVFRVFGNDNVFNNITITGGNNTSDTFGGGAILLSTGELELNRVVITDNFANNLGGGVRANGLLVANTSTFSFNQTSGDGGAISSSAGLEFAAVTINNNDALGGDGGGIHIGNNGGTLINVTLSGNMASQDGGGLKANSGNVVITSTTVTDNTADRGGGINNSCLLYTSPSPRDATLSRMPSSA